MMVVITISNGNDAHIDRERVGDGGDLVATINNCDDADTESERGGEGGDHF